MPDSAGQSAEPTNADPLAVMQAGFAQLTTEIAGLKADVGDIKVDLADLRQDLRNTETAIAARIDSLGHVVRSLKEDLARHVNDPDAHHRHAA